MSRPPEGEHRIAMINLREKDCCRGMPRCIC